MRSDDQDDCGEIIEEITSSGTRVFYHGWDTDSPGAGAGWAAVYELNGKFAVCSSDEDCPDLGPFDSLHDALNTNSLLVVNSTTTDISCSTLTAPEVANKLKCDDANCSQIKINGETWLRQSSGKFGRVDIGKEG